MSEVRHSDFVFPGTKLGRPLSQMALAMLLRRMRYGGRDRSRIRSTFRAWAAERTAFPGEVAEMALAHAVPNAVEAAYRRGDMLEKRRINLMEAWSESAYSQRTARSKPPKDWCRNLNAKPKRKRVSATPARM